MSEPNTIFSTTLACHRAFRVAKSCPRLMHQEWAEDRLAEFNLWSARSGASTTGKTSLDFRLRAHPDAHTILVNLLLMLRILIHKCIAGDSRIDHTIAELSSRELARMKDVEDSLSQLTRLVVAIRKAGVHSRLQKADKEFNSDHTHIRSLRLHLEILLLARPDQYGGSASSAAQLDPTQLTSIQLRLIDANLRRRNRFLYAQNHSRRLVVNSDDLQNIPKRSSVSLDSGKTASPSRKDDTPANNNLQTQSTTTATVVDGKIELPPERMATPATTVVSITSSRVTYPKAPLLHDRQMLFECPCCCQTLPAAVSRGSHWKKHLMGDVLPYTCILEDCPTGASTLYMTRETWFRHMQNDHEGMEQWTCQACSHKNIYISFKEPADLTAHLQNQHSKGIKPQTIPMLLSAWRRKVPFKISACPLCSFDSDDQNALLDHTAEHIHSFSLRSLPWAPTEDLEEVESDLKESEYFKTHPYFDIGSCQSEPSLNSSGNSSPSTGSLRKSSITGSEILADPVKELRDKYGRTPLAQACAARKYDQVVMRFDERPEDLDVCDNAGYTPLQLASLNGEASIVKFLLDSGCEVNTKNIDKDTPLIDAVGNGHKDVVKLLLKAGADSRALIAAGAVPYELLPNHLSDAEFEVIRKVLADAKAIARPGKLTENVLDQLSHDTSNQTAMSNWLEQLSESAENTLDTNNLPLACTWPGCQYSWAFGLDAVHLVKHIKSTHANATNSNLKCTWPACQYSWTFTNAATLRRHIDALHTRTDIYRCQAEGCGKEFVRKDNCRAHMKSAHGVDLVDNDIYASEPAIDRGAANLPSSIPELVVSAADTPADASAETGNSEADGFSTQSKYTYVPVHRQPIPDPDLEAQHDTGKPSEDSSADILPTTGGIRRNYSF